MKTRIHLLVFYVTFFLTLGLPAATYYVSTTGNDSNLGKSISQAFRTVGKINALTLNPGDSVFFQGGGTFTDTGLVLTSSRGGTASSPLTIGSYGMGRATLSPNGNVNPVTIDNTAGIVIRDLSIRGKGLATSTNSGIEARCTLRDGRKLKRLELLNLEISGLRFGISVGAGDASFSGFEDVLMSDCVISDCRREGIATNGYWLSAQDRINQALPDERQSHENITIRNCVVTRVTGDPLKRDNHSGSGIILGGVHKGLIEQCLAYDNGGMAGNYRQPGDPVGMSYGGGPVGIWTWNSDSVTIRHCLVYRQKTNDSIGDGGGFDLDGGTTNAVIEYCYSYNNHGAGFLIYTWAEAPKTARCVLRYNVSWGDGMVHMASGFHLSRGSGTYSTVADIDIHNNLVFSDGENGGGPCVGVYGGSTMSGLRMRNNIFVVRGDKSFVNVDNHTARKFVKFQCNLYYATDKNYSNRWIWGSFRNNGSHLYSSLSAWRAAPETPETHLTESTGIQDDPQIVDLLSPIHPTNIADLLAFKGYALAAKSPAINAGLDLRISDFGGLEMPPIDARSHIVPHGDKYDLGPYESPYPLTAPVIHIISANNSDRVNLEFTSERTDLYYQAEASEDLILWQPITASFSVPIAQQSFRVENLPGSSPRIFYRIRVNDSLTTSN